MIMETAGSHALIIVLAVLHEVWLSRTLASLWPRTQFGGWFPAPGRGEESPAKAKQYRLALRSAHFLSSVTTNRLLCFVTLGLVLGRRDAYGYVFGIATLLTVVWMLSDVDAMSDERFFGSGADADQGENADTDQVGKTAKRRSARVTPARQHLIAVVFLNAVPLLMAMGDLRAHGTQAPTPAEVVEDSKKQEEQSPLIGVTP
jgi:hypothetical protein